MNQIEQYMLPYMVSQVVGIIILLFAWKNSRVARWLFSVMFLYAGIYNMYIGIVKPEAYLGFADLAIPLYRNIINGFFNDYKSIIIPAISIGQLFIGIAMLLNNGWVKWACIGAVIFLLSIAPLLVGAAFPFSITVSIAALLILKKDDLNYLWKRHRILKIKKNVIL